MSCGELDGGRRDPSVLCKRRILKSLQVLSDAESPHRKMFSALVKVSEVFHFFSMSPPIPLESATCRGGQQGLVSILGLQAVRNRWLC